MPEANDLRPHGDLLRVAESAARAAGVVALRGFRGALDVRSKGGKDIVTQYDNLAEDAALQIIHEHYPHDAVLAEESGEGERDPLKQIPTRLWIVDPIDGTHNYAMQLPFWCSSVAVSDAQTRQVLAGAVFDALHGEMFSASLGGGAYLNDTQIHVSQNRELEEAIVTTDIGYDAHIASNMMALAAWVQPRVKRVRLLGSAVLSLAYVAAGRFDAYYHLTLQPWDIAVAALLVREAGGKVTNWEGVDVAIERTAAVAANKTLQPLMLAMLHEEGAATAQPTRPGN